MRVSKVCLVVFGMTVKIDWEKTLVWIGERFGELACQYEDTFAEWFSKSTLGEVWVYLH
jgi:hypothetical protein